MSLPATRPGDWLDAVLSLNVNSAFAAELTLPSAVRIPASIGGPSPSGWKSFWNGLPETAVGFGWLTTTPNTVAWSEPCWLSRIHRLMSCPALIGPSSGVMKPSGLSHAATDSRHVDEMLSTTLFFASANSVTGWSALARMYWRKVTMIGVRVDEQLASPVSQPIEPLSARM